MKIDIGIDEPQREEIAQGLSKLLADTYTLYLKTHNFHWNVTGPMFNTLHVMFEEQYNELWMAIDVVAERIRASVADEAIETGAGPVSVTVSVGVATWRTDEEGASVESRADAALYAAKRCGRNRVRVWNPALDSRGLSSAA